jgi:hypothetical protein
MINIEEIEMHRLLACLPATTSINQVNDASCLTIDEVYHMNMLRSVVDRWLLSRLKFARMMHRVDSEYTRILLLDLY